jgi:hypothetical protein
VSQCQGTTRKGERCKREAGGGAAFCAIHGDQEIRPYTPKARPEGQEWDREALVKTAIGFGLIGAILFLGIRR